MSPVPLEHNPGAARAEALRRRIADANPAAAEAIAACQRMLDAAALAHQEGRTTGDVLMDHAAILAGLGERLEAMAEQERLRTKPVPPAA